jgi:hypothetical protein
MQTLSNGLALLPRRAKPSIRVRGCVNSHTGYGLHVQYVVKHLVQMGFTVETVPVGDVSNVFPEVAPTLLPTPTRQRRELVIMPGSFKAAAHQWLWTMYETTRMPREMFSNIDGAHAVIVPSKWNAECLSAQGLSTPLHVVPLGFNEHIFSRGARTVRTGPLIFGTAGNPSVSVSQRKNLDGVVDAFVQAFPKDPDVRLRIKVLPDCQVPLHGDSRVEIIQEIISEEALADWTRDLDVFVTASRGEAFGFFNIQAMACGVPVISPVFGGVTEYLSEHTGYPVDYTLVRPHITHYNTGLWAEPSLPSLIAQMRSVRDVNHGSRLHLHMMGHRASERALEFTWEKSVQKLVAALKDTNFWESYQPIHGDSDEDKIRKFYRVAFQMPKGPVPDLSEKALTNTPRGLGDTLLFSHLPYVGAVQGRPRFIYANPAEHRHFLTLMKYNNYYVPKPDPFATVAADVLQREVDMGNGHFIQRLQRVFGLEPVLKPQPYLYLPAEKLPNRVVLHFEAGGPHGGWQKANLHPRARTLYEEGRSIVQEFISNHPELEFVQLGKEPVPLERVQNLPDNTLEDTIKLMSASSLFIGIISGPMHVAAAFGVRSIVIINFPPAHKIFLPTLVDIDQVESEWFYPQNVHLHEEGEGPQVQRLSSRTLEMAYSGEVYPYWSDRYLSLINERL